MKQNSNSGFISAGNTAGLMILSRMILGMIQGVSRPAICSNIPNKKSYSLMLDLGANVYVSAENLLQFALMGFAYFSIIDPKRNPKIGTRLCQGSGHVGRCDDSSLLLHVAQLSARVASTSGAPCVGCLCGSRFWRFTSRVLREPAALAKPSFFS